MSDFCLWVVNLKRWGDGARSIISPENRQIFKQIQTPLQQYLDGVVMNPQGEVAPPPPQLQEYWQKNADTIAKIRNLLRFYKLPHYSTSVAWMQDGGATSMPDSIRGLKDVQNILLLDAIAQYRQGKVDLAKDNLEAAYNLALSGANLVSPLEQVDYLDLVRQQALLMRKFEGIPVSVGQRLEKDYKLKLRQILRQLPKRVLLNGGVWMKGQELPTAKIIRY
ncbi:MAG: hypothetical protein ACLFT0_13355 [Spirulinaceae cyanobacterium]